MRALFTQFSLLIGFLAFFEIQVHQSSNLVSFVLGLATACSVYIVLLLGDHTIHKYLDDKASVPGSIRLLESTRSPVEYSTEMEANGASPSFDEGAVKAA